MPGTEQLGRTLVFLDTETTGLDPRRHKLWNVGMVIREPDGEEHHHEWMWWPDLSTADPMALTINRFYDRAGDALVAPWSENFANEAVYMGDSGDPEGWTSEPQGRAAHCIAHYLDQAVIVGAIPWFDVNFLVPWLAEHGHVFTGHYHLVDVEALAAGFIAGARSAIDTASAFTGEAFWAGAKAWEAAEGPSASPPWKSEDLSRAVGIDPDQFDRHTALGDARWAKAIFEAVMG